MSVFLSRLFVLEMLSALYLDENKLNKVFYYAERSAYSGEMNGDNMNLEQKLILLTNSVQSLVEMQAKNEERFTKVAALIESLGEGVARLLNTAEAHDQQLDNHENRLGRLEA